MPIFEYLCDDCGTKFEKLVRNRASTDVLCPSCGESHVTTQLSTFAAHGSSREADRKSTRLNSSHSQISYAVFCLKKKKARNTGAKRPQIAITASRYLHTAHATVHCCA